MEETPQLVRVKPEEEEEQSAEETPYEGWEPCLEVDAGGNPVWGEDSEWLATMYLGLVWPPPLPHSCLAWYNQAKAPSAVVAQATPAK
eukprot:1693574-Alexandrium_andersonii.AAC.1